MARIPESQHSLRARFPLPAQCIPLLRYTAATVISRQYIKCPVANHHGKKFDRYGITASNKIYDASTTATLIGTPGTLAGIVGGDSVSLTGVAVGTFATSSVGIKYNCHCKRSIFDRSAGVELYPDGAHDHREYSYKESHRDRYHGQ